MRRRYIADLWVLALFLCSFDVKGDIFTSVERIKNTFAVEEVLLELLEDYLAAETERSHVDLAGIERFLVSTKQDHAVESGQGDYLDNPINILRILRRHAAGWRKIIKQVYSHNTNASYDFENEVIDLLPDIPKVDDVIGAASAIVRLTLAYDLDLHKLANGTIYDTHTRPLTIDEIYFIGKAAYDKGDYYSAIMWFNLTLNTMNKAEDPEKLFIFAKRLARQLAQTYHDLGFPEYAELVTSKVVAADPSDRWAQVDNELYATAAARLTDTDLFPPLERPPDNNDPSRNEYEALCRKSQKTPQEEIYLKCHLSRTSVPYFVGKEEVVNLEPRISLFHDVISENEAEHVIRASFQGDGLARSQVTDIDERGRGITDDRISQHQFVTDEDPILHKLSKRVQLLTGLSTDSLNAEPRHAEEMQVLNYGIGGMYLSHHDFLSMGNGDSMVQEYQIESGIVTTGDRIATWMFYLTDVKAGGATVFPHLNARIPAVKGAAAFWYNLHRNGSGDERTLHAGCPVLLGSKWVANKWIRSHGQMTRRPCALHRNL